jgi:phosphate transport system substrate-binding protein
MSSRTLVGEERLRLQSVTVARDGIALIVHPDNPVRDVTLAELRAIYAGRQVRWPHAPRGSSITVITREEGSGTRTSFEELVMGGEAIVARALVSDSTGAVNQMVGADPSAIGYVSLGLVDAGVRAIRLGGVEPTEASINSDRYPLVRPFLFVVTDRLEPQARAFLTWVTSPEGIALTRQEGMLPPRSESPHAHR